MELQFIAYSSRSESPIIFGSEKKWFDYGEPDDRFANNINIDIIENIVDDETDEINDVKKVGLIRGTYFDIDSATDEGAVFDVFDCISGDMCHMYEYLAIDDKYFERQEELLSDTMNLFYCDVVYLFPDYRGTGLGRKVIHHLPQIIKQTLCFITCRK